MKLLIRQHQSSVEKICKSLSVERLYIFGSAVNNTFQEGSDLDFLVSFKNNLSADLYADHYLLLHKELEKLFKKRIDLVTERSLSNPFFFESIENSKKLIYDENHQEISI